MLNSSGFLRYCYTSNFAKVRFPHVPCGMISRVSGENQVSNIYTFHPLLQLSSRTALCSLMLIHISPEAVNIRYYKTSMRIFFSILEISRHVTKDILLEIFGF